MPSLQPTFGTPITYAPAEFPKAGRNPKLGQTAVAKDPEHQSQLTEAGFEFTVFVPAAAPGVKTDAVGNAVKEYPKALHGPNGTTAIAKDPTHEDLLAESGWRDKPYPSAVPVSPRAPAPTWPLQPSEDSSELRNKLAEMRQNLDTANATAQKASSERDALQLRVDTAPNQSKAKLQQSLDELQAKHDELKNAHEELLAVVTNPVPVAQ